MAPSGKSWAESTLLDPQQRYLQLMSIIQPLLSLHSVVDDVFSESNAFAEEARKFGYGRIYEEWKRVRSLLDPEYDPLEDRRDRQPRTGVFGGNTFVLQPRRRRPKGGRSLGP